MGDFEGFPDGSQVPALRSAGQAEEALYHWMCNLARQEGLEEKVPGLARRCMAR